MPFVLALFGFLKGIAWPVFAAAFAWVFRADIGAAPQSLRVTKVGLGGVEFAAPIPEQQTGEAETAAKASELGPVATDTEQSAAVRLIASGLKEAVAALLTPEARIGALILALAQARLERGHERVYRMIFGSQITALERLNRARRATLDDRAPRRGVGAQRASLGGLLGQAARDGRLARASSLSGAMVSRLM